MPQQQPSRTAPSPVRVTAAEISRIAGVTRATVSNWRRRHEDFPSPDGGTESSPLYDLHAVRAWLRNRGLTAAASPEEELRTALRLKPTESAPLFDLVVELVERGPGGGALSSATHDGAVLAALVRCVHEAGSDAALGVLAERELEESTVGGTYPTPDELADLMARLLPEAARTVLDPACGGGTLLAAAGRHGAIALHGQDLVPVQAGRAAARLRLAGADGRPLPPDHVRVETGDSLRADAYPALAVDAVLCNPPYGDRDWGHDELAYDPRWAYGVPPRAESELAWVQHALAHLRPDGYAVILLPPAPASRASGRRVRAELVRTGALRAVVSLPAGAAHPFHVGLHLWVLQRPRPSGPERPSVLFVNADPEQRDGAAARRRPAIRADWSELTERVLNVWTAFTDDPVGYPGEPAVARVVPVVDLLGDTVDLTPARHVRTTSADLAPEVLAARLDGLRDRLTGEAAALLAASEQVTREWPLTAPDQGWRTATVADLVRGGALTLLKGPAARDTGGAALGTESDTTPDRPVLTVDDIAAGEPPSGTGPHPHAGPMHVIAPGDIVLRASASRGGPRARVAGEPEAGALLGPHLNLLRPDPARLDSWFLAGFAAAEDNIATASTGSTIVNVNPGRLRLPLLPLEQQRRYGEAFRRLHVLRTAARLASAASEEAASALAAGLASGAVAPPPGVTARTRTLD
ncbi:N-6 DNA methylase [Streptomyces sp. SID8014]|uniref:N-6 DNA methylase n=1 Tax=Streptomyces sp. SID8014 TaxID=2706097 RepID=UPI001940ED15|nr:N-6 DNA methylase [Streptomyces sp. SID8014]